MHRLAALSADCWPSTRGNRSTPPVPVRLALGSLRLISDSTSDERKACLFSGVRNHPASRRCAKYPNCEGPRQLHRGNDTLGRQLTGHHRQGGSLSGSAAVLPRDAPHAADNLEPSEHASQRLTPAAGLYVLRFGVRPTSQARLASADPLSWCDETVGSR